MIQVQIEKRSCVTSKQMLSGLRGTGRSALLDLLNIATMGSSQSTGVTWKRMSVIKSLAVENILKYIKAATLLTTRSAF